MRQNKQRVMAENEALKRKFQEAGLDLAAVWSPTPEDPALENRQLQALLVWLRAYQECPDRRRLEQRGFAFPPVEPDSDPDTDWVRFERWVERKPVEWNFRADFGELGVPEALTDAQIEQELARIEELLAGRGICIELQDGVPRRLVYGYLRRELHETSFEFLGSGTRIHLNACTGYCPGCFQRPWCDWGCGETWPEDEEVGHLVIPDEAKRFAPLTASA